MRSMQVVVKIVLALISLFPWEIAVTVTVSTVLLSAAAGMITVTVKVWLLPEARIRLGDDISVGQVFPLRVKLMVSLTLPLLLIVSV